MNISSEQIVDTTVIRGITVEIQRTTWKNDPGVSYDIIADGEMLTEASFDTPPTGGQILGALRKHATTFCRFCGRGIIGNEGHLVGNAEPGTNPWCCDDDWDERLR